MLWPQPPKCWNYRHVPPHPVTLCLVTFDLARTVLGSQYSQRRKSTQQSCWVFDYSLGVYLYFKNLRINSKIFHVWSSLEIWRIWGGIRMLLNFRELNTEPAARSVCGIRLDSSPRGCQAWNQMAISFLCMQFSPNVCLSGLSKVNTVTKHVTCLPSGWTCFS